MQSLPQNILLFLFYFVYFVDAWVIWFRNFFFQTLFSVRWEFLLFFSCELIFHALSSLCVLDNVSIQVEFIRIKVNFEIFIVTLPDNFEVEMSASAQFFFHAESNENNFNAEKERVGKKWIIFNVRPILIK